MRYMIILLGCLWISNLAAQSYLITVTGDTISGKFKVLKDDEQGEFIKIRSGKKRLSFNPMEVKQAVNKKGVIFSPLKMDGKYKFCTLEQTGYVSLYSFRMREGRETYVNQILVKLDGTRFVVPGVIRQRNLVSDFLFECRVVSNNILDKEKYPKMDIAKIVKDFNACMENPETIDVTPDLSGILSESAKAELDDFKTLLSYSSKIKNKEAVLTNLELLMQKQLMGESVTNQQRKSFIRSLKKEANLIALFERIIDK